MAGKGRLIFGLCCGSDKAHEALAAGFSYVELPAAPLAEGADYSGLPVAATNLFFPGGLSLYSDRAACESHARKVISRAIEFGVPLMVIGSGGVRRAPEGDDPAIREAEFYDFVAQMQDEFHQVILAPESLNRTETNVGNDYGPLAVALAQRGCSATLDAYHVALEPGFSGWEGRIPVLPKHLHLASPSRDMPEPDCPFLLSLFVAMNQMGYSGTASFEGRWNKPLDECHRNLQTLAERAGFGQSGAT